MTYGVCSTGRFSAYTGRESFDAFFNAAFQIFRPAMMIDVFMIVQISSVACSETTVFILLLLVAAAD